MLYQPSQGVVSGSRKEVIYCPLKWRLSSPCVWYSVPRMMQVRNAGYGNRDRWPIQLVADDVACGAIFGSVIVNEIFHVENGEMLLCRKCMWITLGMM